jgi:arylsulfatase A
VPGLQIGYEHSFVHQVADFLKGLETGAPAKPDFADGLATDYVVDAVAQGLRFTDGHSSSGVCSPSRYTLLTGRYHWRTRLQSGIIDVHGEPLIAPDRLTIAGLAQQQGYRTACIGKWHLGWDWARKTEDGGRRTEGGGPRTAIDYTKPIAGGPITRGFDSYFGTDVPNWPPYCFIDGDRTVGIPSELLPASKLVKTKRASKAPRCRIGSWRASCLRWRLAPKSSSKTQSAAKKPFLLYLPLTSPHTPLAVNAEWKGKSGLNSDYADLVMETDHVLGRVLEALKAAGPKSKRTPSCFSPATTAARPTSA